MSLDSAWKNEEHNADQTFKTEAENKIFVAMKKPAFSDTNTKTKKKLSSTPKLKWSIALNYWIHEKHVMHMKSRVKEWNEKNKIK